MWVASRALHLSSPSATTPATQSYHAAGWPALYSHVLALFFFILSVLSTLWLGSLVHLWWKWPFRKCFQGWVSGRIAICVTLPSFWLALCLAFSQLLRQSRSSHFLRSPSPNQSQPRITPTSTGYFLYPASESLIISRGFSTTALAQSSPWQNLRLVTP